MKPPVFIIGSPRSGSSFLYHLLLSAGGFAEFRTQMNFYDVLEPIYGDLAVPKNKQRMLREWLQSKAFQASGLKAGELEEKVMQDCHGGGDFLRIVMEEVAHNQGVDCWVDSTPTNGPHMLRIKRDFSDAKFVHMIRDPRDVVLSLDRKQWTRPLPWDKKNSLLAGGVYWEWIVRTCREYGQRMGRDYLEIHYENLVQNPAEALATVGTFLDCNLNYERIRTNSVGSVKKPLTAFREDLSEGRFNPVARWKEKFPPDKLADFEALIGNYMRELGYTPATSTQNGSLRIKAMRQVYRAYYPFKQWIKVKTPASRLLVSYSDMLFDK